MDTATRAPLVAFPDGKTLNGEAFSEALRINGDTKVDFMRREGVAYNTIHLWVSGGVKPLGPHREMLQKYINRANQRLAGGA